ncbi:MAG: hypothetical protein ACT4QB_24215 [Gammaproteobacteria bacterium]
MKHNLTKSMIALALTGVVGAGPTSVFAALRPLELAVFPEERTIGPGETTTVGVSLTLNSQTCISVSQDDDRSPCPTEVELSLENVPPGITACIPSSDGSCSVLPVRVPFPLATVVLSANQPGGAPGTFLVEAGTYDLRVHAEGIGGTVSASASAPLQLTVQPFSLSFPPVVKMPRGSTVTVPMSILRAQGFVTPVSLQGPLHQIGSPEDDVTVQFSPNPIEGSSGSMSVMTGGDLAKGAHTVLVKGTTQVDGVQLTRTKTLTVHVLSFIGSF